MPGVRTYRKFKVAIEEEGTAILDLFGNSESTVEVELTLYDDHAHFHLPGVSLRLPYTKENAKVLVEFLRIFAERVKLEEERARLLR
ncbi:hypothetical protein [Thermococcus sp. MV11]|uniref:hypothetical protein n=1 Tax=Thermococcus sp. MV11 TaxID=1638267 RepID=UPI001430AD31|nr:hypothetical protein [Thermococcus sp. MV11]NJE02970.1 hypothetical protein [Thermococcus sp. MV11]